MVSTRDKAVERGEEKDGGIGFSSFEKLLKNIVNVPKAAVDQAEKKWKRSAARRRKKRRGRAEE